jgi:hypothetical protein
MADIRMSTAGTGEVAVVPAYHDGTTAVTVKRDDIAQDVQASL